ncbi:MAG: PhzF family phenazine biosynthesis isomerase [Candidatus Korobacteraceae bacterium]
MRMQVFQVDAFATRRFTGNPAAVVPMDGFPDDAVLQAIAAENNLSETAFMVRDGGDYRLRWFTPLTEVPLCGHATLASAAVVMERLEPGRSRVVFRSASGPLTVNRAEAGYVMDFRHERPSQPRRRRDWPKRWAFCQSKFLPIHSTTWFCWRARRYCASLLRI